MLTLRKMAVPVFVVIVVAAVLTAAGSNGKLPALLTNETAQDISETEMSEKQWFVLMYRPRQDLVQAVIEENLPAADAAIVGNHFQYLKEAFRTGRVVLVARTKSKSESDFGIVVFHAESAELAHDFMVNDPAVAGGVFLGEVRPASLALLAGRD